MCHPVHAHVPSTRPWLTAQQRRRQAAVVLAAALNAAVSRSLWTREQSGYWWERECRGGWGGGVGVVAVMFLSLCCHLLSNTNTRCARQTLVTARFWLTFCHNAGQTQSAYVHILMQCMLPFSATCILFFPITPNKKKFVPSLHGILFCNHYCS